MQYSPMVPTRVRRPFHGTAYAGEPQRRRSYAALSWGSSPRLPRCRGGRSCCDGEVAGLCRW